MPETSTSPVLEAVVRVALEATGATRGRLLTAGTGALDLMVVASLGGDASWQTRPPGDGDPSLVGYVVATGQPQMLTGRGDDAWSCLCAPCIRDDEVVGALELAGKAGGGAFSFDDIEMASLFAGVAGAAIVARHPASPPAPEELTGDLARLERTDPARYATVARLVYQLLYA
jgi:GAF domain-containing protein